MIGTPETGARRSKMPLIRLIADSDPVSSQPMVGKHLTGFFVRETLRPFFNA